MNHGFGATGSFRDLFEHAPCGYFSSTPEGIVARVNETFLQMSGYSREEVLGKSFEALLTPGSQLFLQTRYLPVLHLNGEVRGVVVWLMRREADPLPVLISSNVRRGPDGAPMAIRTAVLDATERENYERELLAARRAAELSESRVRVLERASSILGSADTVESLVTAMAETARSAFDAGSAAVLLLDEGGELQTTAGTLPLGHDIPIAGLGPEIEALRLNRVVAVEDISDSDDRFPGLRDALGAARVESLFAAPLFEGNTALGVLLCFFLRRRNFDAEASELLATLARQSAQVLQRLQLQNQLRHLALHDQLTGLANRKLLQNRLEQVLSAAVRHDRPVALIYLDLDGFKSINDEWGHPVGDEVLKQVSDRLRVAVRASDTIARVGGDEFVILCEDADAQAAAEVSLRVREAVARQISGPLNGHRLTASVGVALFAQSSDDDPPRAAEALLKHADAAMYRSKREGKNQETIVTVLA